MKSLLSAFLVCSLSLVCLLTFSSTGVAADGGSRLSAGELPPPVIVAPVDRAQLSGIDHVTFKWREVKGASGYHLIMATDRRFKNIVSEDHHIDGTSYTVLGLNYGTYFMKISSVSPDGAEGPFSQRRSFIVVPPPPAEASP